MPRNITVTFADGSTHVYHNAPDNVSPQQVSARAQSDFGKQVKALDGGRGAAPRPAARPAPAKPASMGTNAINSLAAVGGALWRGAAALPDMAADAGDAVVGGVANALGVPYPKGKPFRLGDVPDKLGTPRMTSPGGELAANFVGGMMVPGPKIATPSRIRAPVPSARPVSQAARVVESGQQAGIRVLTSDVKPPRTFVGKVAQATGERIIGTGTGSMRAAQQEQRVAAVKSILSDFNAVGADDAADHVVADLAKTRGAAIENLAKAKAAVINGTPGEVPVPSTIRAIDEQVTRLRAVGTDAANAVIGKLQNWRSALQVAGQDVNTGLLDASGDKIIRRIPPKSKSLDTIELIRKEMGDAFKGQGLENIRSTGEAALSKIYGPMRADMGNFIKTTGGQGAFARWKNANDQLAAMAGELGNRTFKSVLADAQATPENVAKMLFSKKPSDVARLYSNLSAEGRLKAQSAVLHRAMDKAGGFENISPDRFVNQIEALGRTAGVHFQAPDLVRLEGLTRVLNATQRAATASVAPPTGVQTAVAAVYGGAGAAGGLPALLGVQGYGLIARAYESAPVRNALLRLGRAPKGSPQEAVELGRVMTAMTSVAERYKAEIGAVANDNLTTGLASDPTQQKQTEEQAPPQP